MSTLAGAGRLLRLGLRRDRVLLPCWVGVLAVSTASSASATSGLYPSAASQEAAARAVNLSPAVVAMYGPIHDVHSLGALSMFKAPMMSLVMAFLAMVVVRRHTRVEEESGRTEVLTAAALGRDAPLFAALAEAVLALGVLCLLVLLGNVAAGLEVVGSCILALGWFGLGVVAAALTGLVAQLSSSARTVAGLCSAALVAAYVLRAAGDAGGRQSLVWASPFGWVEQMRAYQGDRVWPFLLLVLMSLALTAGALVLSRRRDVGSGLLSARPGPERGSAGSLPALWWRLHRVGLVGWLLGITALGAVVGAIVPSAAGFTDSPAIRAVLQRAGGVGALQDVFLALQVAFAGVAVTAYGVSVVTRAAGEEQAGRISQLLATGASRRSLLGTLLAWAVGAPAILLVGYGLGVALALGSQVGDPIGQVTRMVPASLGQLPAVVLVVALALLVWALRPAWAALGWGVLVVSLLLGQLGEMLNLPTWVVRLSPYVHLPRMPAESFRWDDGVLTLLGLALAAFLAAAVAWRRRDVG